MTLFFVPFEEAKQNKSVDNYLKNVGGKNNADGFGAQAWTAGLFFRDVVNNVVKADGDNGLTRPVPRRGREGPRLHSRRHARTDRRRRPQGQPCGVILQVKNGKFVRVSPKKKGTLDCSGAPRPST